uniref:Adenylosuccinate synthetase n=1 Tax=Chromera velia CCMP2878 TaxID=1169474 RepID=A0A0G4ICB5_9ALVE|mmetsp:Transcript_30030/g.58958  ORF Transcript_30030/g.58958 Transcript_30030/m.58958 type:complete len:467 (-) Transcript_30030:207-1607(-)|eukprot:Cvel_2237.t1-p1 / transcript=Cvel_2237.t1 / gene=Cvel_2237 / organism=Chromera_velia_CCMP2878 / gene_product=Adenylosuccinate synthetase, putative / transcript_product=Adenylosuccinate synthetase, putative / location=Cvel_scaffold86:57111-64701(-) / protein_length=466 / sequence_SO=supercontig / SO=protein_coding / is_pseudo=false
MQPSLRKSSHDGLVEFNQAMADLHGFFQKPLRTDSISGAGALVVAVLGAQWGDEGKGKLVDILASEAQMCCRFNGGSNAGHTLVVGGKKYAFHLLPCGILYPKCQNVIGNGVVVHIKQLMQELEQIKSDFPDALQRLFISSRAHIVFDFHQLVDGLQEGEKLEEGVSIGTTKKGIGPTYSSKAARSGLRIGDLRYFEEFEKKYRRLLKDYQRRFSFEYDAEEELARHRQYAEVLNSRLCDNVYMLHNAMSRKEKILVEGANATMLDMDFGTYPFVTSSSTSVGGIMTGLGIPPQAIHCTIGVVKAYTTRVGEGPFPTELFDDVCRHMQEVGKEFGTTTGRRRRCGWLDIPQLKYACMVNGISSINLTKLDVLTGLKEVKICVVYLKKDGYAYPLGEYPSHHRDLSEVQCVYEVLPGWSESVKNCTSIDQLPQNAKDYIQRVEFLLSVPISWIGVGPDRLNTIRIRE